MILKEIPRPIDLILQKKQNKILRKKQLKISLNYLINNPISDNQRIENYEKILKLLIIELLD